MMHRYFSRCATWSFSVAIAAAAALAGNPAYSQSLEFKQGDHVTLIGNVLAERMQHDGWLETLIQARFPESELSFRNLGFSGDEINQRLRSANFGSPDEWLARTQADVVFAFFGYNESFADEAGLEQFKQELGDFIQHTLAQRYDGESPARLVLFSPIAFEDIDDPNVPDGAEHNRRLGLYTRAMAELAAKHNVPIVDLFHPTLEAYEASEEPLTLNGHFLNERGNLVVAEIAVASLFPASNTKLDAEAISRLREAVTDKNFYWFHRYRTTDGYNVYGGRSSLKYTDDISNWDVMQREMEILDVMTANRDKAIWSVARSPSDVPAVDDRNTPPFIPVKTNMPGPLEGGKHKFFGGEEAISMMTVAEGMKVELFASEEMFPELVNPVQMAFDPQGRLWVAAWQTYPHWKPKDPMDDKLLILEDTDGDGRANVCKTFAGGLHNPTGFEFWGGGVLVALQPDLWFLKDTDGDDVADVRERVLHGLDSADTHHAANSFVLAQDGAMYFQEGTFHQSQIETIHQGSLRNNNACVWRFDPRTWRVDRYIPYDFANPHGHVFDRWGNDFVHDGTSAQPWHGSLFSGHLEFPAKHPKPPQLYQQRTRPCPATEILSSRHFPERNQGSLLVGNVIGFQGILQYKIEPKGSSYAGTEIEPIVHSSDPKFRPVDLEIAPDGALYFTDWQNPIIGHMQHHIRDPNRDQEHGRVYRITYPGRPLLAPPQIAGQPIEELLELLKSPENRVRYRARIELSARDSQDVLAAANRWVAGLDASDPDHEHHLLEALWLHQQHNVVNEELLRRVLQSPDHRARTAGVRIISYWTDRVDNSLALLKQLAADEHPRVRLEAVRAASFYKVPEAVEIPIIAAEYPTDEYLDFVRDETMKALEPFWMKALREGRKIAVTSEAGMRYLLRNVSTEELLQMPRDRAVLVELLYRPDVRDEQRREAVAGLAKLDEKSELRVLLDAIQGLDAKAPNMTVVYALVRMLTERSPSDLAQVRSELEKMTTAANIPVLRQIGYVALISADGGADKAWDLARQSPSRLADLVNAVPLIPDPSVQASLYPQIAPLLDGLPKPLAADREKSQAAYGRFVRVELPGKSRTLTLAEVEVMSDGRNVARQGMASQSGTAHGGEASRGIDGKTDGAYGAGGQTHTPENQPDPWWEVDLGGEYPIDSIVIHNRTDGDLGKRLDGFTLRVLDRNRNEIYREEAIAAPKTKAAFDVGGGGPGGLVRRAAMNALTYIRGKEEETFESLAGFIRQDVDRLAAIRALQRIPRRFWPQAEAAPLVESLVTHIEKIPPKERTSPAALEALQLSDALASLLPPDAARQVRSQLGELGVQVIRIGTRPHRMSYDKERLAVRAGKPVEFLFDNSDIMPHNFVIVQPGSLEEVGLLAEATAQQPDAQKRQFVPRSDRILLASDLLQPQETQNLSFTAPSEPGVYPYVCTYPGHWRRMYGALYVVENLEDYRGDPEAYLAANPLPIEDDLLRFNRPRTEWTFEDLAPLVSSLEAPRSFGNAKQMFEVATCVACHKFGGVGHEFGPDLAKLDPKLTTQDILRDLLEPSHKVNEKFEAHSFILEDGKIVTGMILEETPEAFKVIVNPLASQEPTIIPKAQVEEQVKSKTSLMPQGLLDKLTAEEILDLVAYIRAGGNEKHPLF
ncbi:MAG: discoidin domain-containing protein, partial [Planctomycetes bacterium]|nr:discoidin domain-containing protein [Planctomycetota bacterium]